MMMTGPMPGRDPLPIRALLRALQEFFVSFSAARVRRPSPFPPARRLISMPADLRVEERSIVQPRYNSIMRAVFRAESFGAKSHDFEFVSNIFDP